MSVADRCLHCGLTEAVCGVDAAAGGVCCERCTHTFADSEPAPAPAGCHAADGQCTWDRCPQLAEREPRTSGRHCPLDSRPPLPPPNPLLMATVDGNPAVPLNEPAAPAVPQAGDGLREELAGTLTTWVIGVAHENAWNCADRLLALPAVQRLLAADAAVQRVRAVVAEAEARQERSFARMFGGRPFPAMIRAEDLRRALNDGDGS